MAQIVVSVKNADACDRIEIFIDGVSYGKKMGNATFTIPATEGPHVIHGIYDNVEDDFVGIAHGLDPISFRSTGGTQNFEVQISNICSGGRLRMG